MQTYLIKRLISALFVIWSVLTLVFFTIHLAPGDPVEVILGEQATVADKDLLRQQLNLHLPLTQQYSLYLQNLVQGDLGQSIHHKKPVFDILSNRILNTAKLALTSIIIAIALAFPLGLLAAYFHGRWIDTLTLNISLIGISVPNFVLGPLLIIVFSLWFQWLPTGGAEETGSIILPAIALGTAMMAVLARMLRANLLDVWHEKYLLAARARGISLLQSILRHALPNALLPVLTIIGLQFGTLLGGAVITEVVFSWPGIGSTLIKAIETRDYPVVQSCILIVALAYVVINLLTDLLYTRIDSRIILESNS